MGRKSLVEKFGPGVVAAKPCLAPWLPEEARGHIIIIDQQRTNYDIENDRELRWIIMHSTSTLFVGVKTKAHAVEIMNETVGATSLDKIGADILPSLKEWNETYRS